MAASSLQSLNHTFSQTLASPNTSPSFRSPFLRFNSSFTPKPLSTRSSSSLIARSAAEPQERKTFHGLCYVVGDNIDTDQIIPAEFLTLVPSNPDEYEKLGSYALIGLPASYKDRFVQPGEMKTKYSIIIGGENFGGECIMLMRVDLQGRHGDIELRDSGGLLTNHTTKKKYKLNAIGDAQPVIDARGIFAYATNIGMIPSPSVA
uniref:Aconitase A/isopropylmalate dehydratase small subunit swivel domain-containing protein n=1 Tax=Brassica campestris TaxID=3711 RepID=M4C7W0_BRACM